MAAILTVLLLATSAGIAASQSGVAAGRPSLPAAAVADVPPTAGSAAAVTQANIPTGRLDDTAGPAAPQVWRLRDIEWTRQIGDRRTTIGWGPTLTTTALFSTGLLTFTLSLPDTIVEEQPYTWDLTLRGSGISNPWNATILGLGGSWEWNVNPDPAISGQPFALALRGNALWGNPRGGWRTELRGVPHFADGQSSSVYCELGCLGPPLYPMFRGGNTGSPMAFANPHWEAMDPAASIIRGRVYATGGDLVGGTP
jgi:hypothetical protein